MKLAITMVPESGRISPVFETAEHLLIVRFCRNGNYSVLEEKLLPSSESEKISLLRNSSVRMLICGAVTNETLEKLQSNGVRVVPFVSGQWDLVLDAALTPQGTLPPDLIMPGCCRHHRKCCENQGEKGYENCIDQSGCHS